jgi:hypothetical protein
MKSERNPTCLTPRNTLDTPGSSSCSSWALPFFPSCCLFPPMLRLMMTSHRAQHNLLNHPSRLQSHPSAFSACVADSSHPMRAIALIAGSLSWKSVRSSRCPTEPPTSNCPPSARRTEMTLKLLNSRRAPQIRQTESGRTRLFRAIAFSFENFDWVGLSAAQPTGNIESICPSHPRWNRTFNNS